MFYYLYFYPFHTNLYDIQVISNIFKTIDNHQITQVVFRTEIGSLGCQEKNDTE
jgi:hypothetical protein